MTVARRIEYLVVIIKLYHIHRWLETRVVFSPLGTYILNN